MRLRVSQPNELLMKPYTNLPDLIALNVLTYWIKNAIVGNRFIYDIYVRYLDMGTGVVTSFIGIEDTKFATAEGMDP